MKSHKGWGKRVKLTANGKLRRKKSSRRHLLSNKTAKHRRRLRENAHLGGRVAKKVRDMIPRG